jgi:hypothetical protein
MLQFNEVNYSESASVTATSDLFKFLTKMYLDEETVE